MPMDLWSMPLSVPLAAGAVVLFCCLAAALKLRAVAALSPPGPKPLPIVGNLFDVRHDIYRRFAELAAIYGPVFSFQFGLTRCFVVSSADAARDVLHRHDQLLAAHAVPDAATAAGHSARSLLFLPSTSPLWKQQRAACAGGLFSHRALESAVAVRECKARELVGELRQRYAGQAVELRAYFFGTMLNVTSNMLLSEDVVDLASPEAVDGFKELVESIAAGFAMPNISDLFPFLRALDLEGRRRAVAAHLARLYEILDRVIERRRSDGKKYGDFLHYLLSTDTLERRSVVALLAELLMASSETTSSAMEWTMAELLRNPSKMAKVREEINRAAGAKRAVQEADAAELPYLHAALCEALRLHPPGPLLVPRETMADGAVIGGFPVRKGTRVFINVWAMMRDAQVYPEPNEFAPERFLAKPAGVRVREFEFLPFGAGRRACPGEPLAARMAPLVLASLLHAFEWRLADGLDAADVDLDEKFASVLSLAVPLRAVPFPVHHGEAVDG